MDKKLLGRRINLARKDKGLTSEKLSEACNINATYLRQIEAGSRTPSLPIFISICEHLSVSPSYLLADQLNNDEASEMDILFELWRKATPKQIKMITSIIRSALENA